MSRKPVRVVAALRRPTELAQSAKLAPPIWSVLAYVVAMSNKLPWSVHVERRLARGIRDIGSILPIPLVARLDAASRRLGQSRSASVTQAVAQFLERRSPGVEEG